MRKSYWFFGHRLTILAGSADTGGHYDLIEGWDPPGTQVPLHLHRRYSEQIYVLEGELTAWAGKRKVVLRPGDDVVIPAGTVHTWAVTGDGGQHPVAAVAGQRQGEHRRGAGGVPDPRRRAGPECRSRG